MRDGGFIDCQQTGRKAHLMESDSLYCDVIVQRFEQLTGKEGKKAKRSM